MCIFLHDSVCVHLLYYRQFLKERLPPIQFKNPNVQFVLFKNRKPTPFVDIYFGKLVYRPQAAETTARQ